MPNNIQGNRPGALPARNADNTPATAEPTAKGAAGASANADTAAPVRTSAEPLRRNSAMQASLVKLDREARQAAWTDWAKTVDPTAGENRSEAAQRMTACLNGNQTSLNITSLSLTSLPERLPAGLRRLNISGNQLTRLPETLPSGLRELYVSGNQLTRLPGNLPSGLEYLYVSGNQLTRLPEHLPSGLQHLFVNNNRLISLTQTLPAELIWLTVQNNHLSTLPEHLPTSLRGLNLTSNRLTTLPDSIFQLSPHCEVDVSNNPLNKVTRNQLLQRIAHHDYRGPQIHFSTAEGMQLMPPRPLQNIVANWPRPPGMGAAQDDVLAAMDKEFINRLQARLLETGQENDVDAQLDIGPQVHAEIVREVMTRHGLQDHFPVS